METALRQLIAGNWKMNPPSAAAASALATAMRQSAVPGADLLVCPPATALATVRAALAGSAIALGAQDCNADPAGPHTGDIAAAMLIDAGCTHVILGHSERRADHGETDEGVRRKVETALAAGLIPIVCVGETQEQRLSGRETEIVGWQLEGSLPKDFEGIIAYEPIWAIGTGHMPSEDEVATMHSFIFEELTRQFAGRAAAWPVLYGGSVKPANAAALLRLPHVGGALVGGASLDAADFLAIASACA
jgi:triosephosphate isomerase